jgi:multicomponent Na+:H+ antiporter subunit D
MIPVLLLALPFFGMFFVWALAWKWPTLSKGLACLIAAAGIWLSLQAGAETLAIGIWHYELGGWAAPWGIEIQLTPFGCFWTGLLYLLTLLTLTLMASLKRPVFFHPDFFDSALLLLAGSFAALALTRDLFDFYLWVELALMAAGLLIARSGPDAFLTAFRFVFWGSVSASFMLLGFLYLYAGTGTLDLDDTLSQLLILKNGGLIGFAGFWVTVGLSLPLMFPAPVLFHSFLSRIPSILTAFLAPVLGRAAALLLFELYFSTLGAPDFHPPLWLTIPEQIAAVLFLAHFWVASRAKTWTRVAGFLSVGSLGYVLVGFVLGTTIALQGVLLELVNQLVTVAGLFYLGAWLEEAAGTDEIARLGGAGRRQPWIAVVFLLLGFNLVGIPPFGGFFGKVYLFESALQQQQWFFAVVLLTAYGFSFYFLCFLGWKLFTRPESPSAAAPVSLKKGPWVLVAALWIMALGGLAFGICHKSFLRDVVTPALPKAFQHWTPPLEPWNAKDVE